MSQSIKSDHISESTVARIAGNLLSGRDVGPHGKPSHSDYQAIAWAVEMARAIAAEVKRTSVQAIAPVAEERGLFYLQDARSFVGNCVLWWAKDGKGYVCDLRLAHRYTFEEAMAHHRSRKTDLPWSCEEIDAQARPVMDMQGLRSEKEQVQRLRRAERELNK